MKIATTWTTDEGVDDSVESAYQALKDKLGGTPSFMGVYGTVAYDLEQVLSTLRALAPVVPIQGGTSCLGVMTEEGFHGRDGSGLGLFGVRDPDGRYGVGAAVLGSDARRAAKAAMRQALTQADCAGEVPALVWLTAAPGQEEQVIAGISEVIGRDVPIVGGSAADNTVTGNWRQLANGEVFSDAVTVAAMFPSRELLWGFHSGYEPTAKRGTVTRAEGRTLLEIDGQPAARVYNDWCGGEFSDVLGSGGNVLARTTLHPLAREVGKVGGVPYYQLSHPDAVTAQDGLSLFTDIAEGDDIVFMEGTVDSLVSRAGRVAAAALDTYDARADEVAGALVVYCAGCMLTVQDRMDEVVEGLRSALPGTPFLGLFTFGEQGCFVGGENRHGNLMISVLLFRK
ncbi:MAG TPA: hypothetical protein ENJ19_11530 [Gammaproteobacteria bacterium]|nr:hypothetical protein [Gammaproteobacteria bacterium]